MGKKHTASTAGTPRNELDANRLALMAQGKQQFMDAAITMGWQLTVTVIVPVIIGVQLDNYFHSSPAYTLAALFLAICMSCGVVWKALRGASQLPLTTQKGKKPSAK